MLGKVLGLLFSLIAAVSVAAAVAPPAQATPPHCNIDSPDWPDCLPSHDDLFRALFTTDNSAYFWSGRIGGEHGESVIDRAGEIAAMYGGTTLEQALWEGNVGMPQFTDVGEDDVPLFQGQLADDRIKATNVWNDASRTLAARARGVVFVVRGDWVRPNNVWDTVEKEAVQNNPLVDGIVEIDAATLEETPIWWRPGNTPDELMRQAALTRAQRFCPTIQDQRFPGSQTTQTGSLSVSPPQPIATVPPRYHNRLTTSLYHGRADVVSIRLSPSQVEYPLTPVPFPVVSDNLARTREWFSTHTSLVANFHGSATTPTSYRLLTVTPTGVHSYVGAPGAFKCQGPHDELRKRDIRLMPLGDSITYGVQSSDGNGFRNRLHSDITSGLDPNGTGIAGTTAAGSKAVSDTTPADPGKGTAPGGTGGKGTAPGAAGVNFVGTQRGGTMGDNDNEGHPGFRIDQVAKVAQCSVAQYQPNVVTLLVGTNDADQNFQVGTAANRINALINQVLAESPKATVLVSEITPTGKPGLQPRIDEINDGIAKVVDNDLDAGKHVMEVLQDNIFDSEGLQDDAHPDDSGYQQMGDNFYEALEAADGLGWLTTPDAIRSTSQACDPGASALGPGWRKLGVLAPGTSDAGRVVPADVNGDRRADYVKVHRDGSFRALLNERSATPGHPHFVDLGDYAPYGRTEVPADPTKSVASDGFQFADVNGDGRADLLHVTSDGEVSAFLNLPGPNGKLDFVKWGIIFDQGKFDGSHIRFADVNGDGHADLLVIAASGGAVDAYLNVPNSRDPALTLPTWRLVRSWAPGAPGGDLASLRFADVNGDGKADYLTVGSDGSVHAYLNDGGRGAGGFTPHLNFVDGTSFAPQDVIQFADISGDGKADYLAVYHQGAVRAWLNRGGNV